MVKLFFSGLVAALPIATGYVPVAITFGILVVGTGLSLLDAVFASAIVFAGATQILAIGMYGAAAAAVQIVIAGWLLNMRHLLMSSVIAHNLAASPAGMPRLPVRSVIAFGVTDEVFGVASLRAAQGDHLRPAFIIGLEFGAYAAWVGGTAVGATVGEILPPGLRTAMGLALYALFAALLAGQLRAARAAGASPVEVGGTATRADAGGAAARGGVEAAGADAAAGGGGAAWAVRLRASRAAPVVIAATVAASLNVVLRGPLGIGAGAAFPPAMLAGALAGWIVATVQARPPARAAEASGVARALSTPEAPGAPRVPGAR